MKVALAKAFGWSLFDIDRTDIESLFPFVFRWTADGGAKKAPTRRAYADEVNWL